MATALAKAQALAAAAPGSPDAALVLGDTLATMDRLPQALCGLLRAPPI